MVGGWPSSGRGAERPPSNSSKGAWPWLGLHTPKIFFFVPPVSNRKTIRYIMGGKGGVTAPPEPNHHQPLRRSMMANRDSKR